MEKTILWYGSTWLLMEYVNYTFVKNKGTTMDNGNQFRPLFKKIDSDPNYEKLI